MFSDKQNEVFGKLFSTLKQSKEFNIKVQAHALIEMDDENFVSIYTDKLCTLEGTKDEIEKCNLRAKDGLYSCCRNCENIKSQEYKNKNRKDLREYDKKRYYENHEKLKQKSRDYFNEHKLERKIYAQQYFQKIKNNLEYRIKHSLQSRIIHAVKKQETNKSNHTNELIGCSFEELKQHLEKQFTEGMSWKNYGRTGWHIDHIKPCFLFDLTKKDEQQQCFNYTNLRPLWWKDNLSRSYEEFRKV